MQLKWDTDHRRAEMRSVTTVRVWSVWSSHAERTGAACERPDSPPNTGRVVRYPLLSTALLPSATPIIIKITFSHLVSVWATHPRVFLCLPRRVGGRRLKKLYVLCRSGATSTDAVVKSWIRWMIRSLTYSVFFLLEELYSYTRKQISLISDCFIYFISC